MKHQEAKKILEEFERTILIAVRQYISSVGLSSEVMVEWNKRGGYPNQIEQEFCDRGQDPRAWCIVAFLRRGLSELPQNISLPKNFKGLNVYLLPAPPMPTARPAYPDEGE